MKWIQDFDQMLADNTKGYDNEVENGAQKCDREVWGNNEVEDDEEDCDCDDE
jgi:hypothetical protein